MSEIQIYTIDSEFESAKRLGFKTNKKLGYADTYNDRIVVRWGNSQWGATKDGRITEFRHVVNPREAICTNCRKPYALSLLRTVVNTPKMWRPGETVPAQQIVVHRPTEHSGGKGFKIDIGPFVVKNYYYATEWLQSNTEIRVWFVGDRTMCCKRVPYLDNHMGHQYPCRSTWGYRIYDEVPRKLHLATLKAAKIIGLEFGAADVIELNGKYYFLELNSAPSIDKQAVEDFYRDGLNALIQKKFPAV